MSWNLETELRYIWWDLIWVFGSLLPALFPFLRRMKVLSNWVSNPELPLDSPLYWYEFQGAQGFLMVHFDFTVVSWEGWTRSKVSKRFLSLIPYRSLGKDDGINWQWWEGLTYFLDCISTSNCSNWSCTGQKRCAACRRWLQFLVVEARHWLHSPTGLRGAGHPCTPILCFSFVGVGASRCPWNSPVFQESGAIYLEGALVA